MNQAQVNITNSYKKMEEVFQQISEGSATVNLPTQQLTGRDQFAPHLHYPQEIDSGMVPNPAPSLDNQTAPIFSAPAQNDLREWAKLQPHLHVPGDQYTAPVDEEQPQTGQEADCGAPEGSGSAAANISKKCLPSLPSRNENFVLGFDVELTRSNRFYLCLSVSMSLFQKFLAYTAWVDCGGDTWETEVFVNQLTVAFLILTFLLRLVKDQIRKSWLAGLVCFFLDAGVIACYYSRGLHDIRGGGNIKAVFYLVYLTNLAGDLALAVNLLLSRKTLKSGRVYFTTLCFFIGLLMLTHKWVGVWRWVPMVFVVFKGLLIGSITSSVVAKEVMGFKETLAEEGEGSKVGESFYRAITSRTNAFGRQLLLVYSKLFSTEE